MEKTICLLHDVAHASNSLDFLILHPELNHITAGDRALAPFSAADVLVLDIKRYKTASWNIIATD